MDAIPQASLFLGIIPALALLYISLKGYEGYYKDKYIFLTFVLGLIIGFFSAIARLLINPLPGLIIFIILFSIFEQLFKTIFLNYKKLQDSKVLIIYGLSLGLGFGSVFTPFLILAGSSIIGNDLYILSLITIGSFGIILFHGATGALIGYGIHSGKLIKYLLIAILIEIPFNFIIDIARFYQNEYFILIQFCIIIYGGIVFIYVLRKIMPKILSKSQKRKRSKKLTS